MSGGVAPDDQMRGLRDVFGDVGDESDDTSDIPRQTSLGGLSSLSNRATSDRDPVTDPPVHDVSIPATPDPPPEPADRGPGAVSVRMREPKISQRRQKTSFSLDPELRERISTAYTRDRWTMAELVSQGLERVESGRISRGEIERSIKALSFRSGSAIKSVNLGVDDLAVLDELAASMRLSRSQLISVVVSLVLDSL